MNENIAPKTPKASAVLKVETTELTELVTFRETQAERILTKFGGAMKIHLALKAIGKPKSFTTIYKWNYTREKDGTNGVIPADALVDVCEAARIEGVFLTAEDLDPRPKIIKRRRKLFPKEQT